MRLLALDTSSMTATVALMEDERLIGEYTLNHKKSHSQTLMPMIEELMKSCNLKAKDIDVFAVSLGPGSFTGLRIGIATASSMAQALGKKAVGVSTLEALAYNLFNCEGLVCPIIDAQRNLVYTGLYQWIHGELREVMGQQILEIEELMDLLMEENKTIYFVGDAVGKFSKLLEGKLGSQFKLPPGPLQIPLASSVAELARLDLEKGIHRDLAPIYMRKSAAEVQYEQRMKGRE